MNGIISYVSRSALARARHRPQPRCVANELVSDVMVFVRRYVVVSPDKLLVIALWILHTYCVERFEQTPYLSVTSPERQCGKSRLLEVLDLLVARPWQAVLPSEAVVYRNVDLNMPTLLLDEVDTIFNPRSMDRYEGLRALLNAGHRRGAKVPRCVGTSNKIVEFSVYCAKALAGIGTLPDTVADRAIPIRMERRTRAEPVEKLRRREAEPAAASLCERIAAWIGEHGEELASAAPPMPDELSDRMQDGCEPLIALADLLTCGAEARAALVALLTGERLDNQESMRLRLLADIRTVFDASQHRTIATTVLLQALCSLDGEAPWASWYGRGLEARDLASLLGQYGIRSKSVRLGEQVAKGFRRDDFHEPWQRYLP